MDRWYECWVTLAPKGPTVQVRRAWCASAGHMWGAAETQAAAIDALATSDPRTGRADWTHGLVTVRRPLGSRNLTDELTTTLYPTDRVEDYEDGNAAHGETTASRAAAECEGISRARYVQGGRVPAGTIFCSNCGALKNVDGSCACSRPSIHGIDLRDLVHQLPIEHIEGARNAVVQGGTYTLTDEHGVTHGPYRHDGPIPIPGNLGPVLKRELIFPIANENWPEYIPIGRGVPKSKWQRFEWTLENAKYEFGHPPFPAQSIGVQEWDSRRWPAEDENDTEEPN